MTTRRSSLTQIFLRGIGFKTTLSYIPPVAVAWAFFILYLRGLPPAEFWTALGLGLAGIGIGSVVVIRLILFIVPPLHRIIEVTDALSNGETVAAIPYGERTDEIGDMARALDVFRRTALEKQALERDQATLKQRAEEERRTALAQVADGFEQHVGAVVRSVVASVTTLRGSAQSMAATAVATSGQVGTVAQTGRATEDITHRIQAIQSGTAETVAAMRRIAETIGEMTGISGSVRQAIESQDDATGAIVRNIEHAARGTLRVSDNIRVVGEAARGTGDTAAAISAAAVELAEQSGRLRQEVETFLGQVRSA